MNSVASNNVNDEKDEADQGSVIPKEENVNSVFGLNAEQYEGLMKLL